MNKTWLIVISILIPPLGLIYLLAALNLNAGYSKLYCGAKEQATFRDKVVSKLEAKGLPVAKWLREKPKSC